MSEGLSGRIVRIVSNQEVLINKGTDDGVSVGEIFVVISSETEEVKDEATDEVLGKIRKVKIPLKVTEASERMSLLHTYRTVSVNVGGEGLGLGRMFAAPKWETQDEEINTDAEFAEDYVEVGDHVTSYGFTKTDPPSVLFVK
ncbi:hypothetical protein [Streptomonospora arabica]|uniref:Uncharacterized protein n=1 Tax=Streptomonospora arabica TaxID=412417 RepID=A0ABV9SLB3_9ACTN